MSKSFLFDKYLQVEWLQYVVGIVTMISNGYMEVFLWKITHKKLAEHLHHSVFFFYCCCSSCCFSHPFLLPFSSFFLCMYVSTHTYTHTTVLCVHTMLIVDMKQNVIEWQRMLWRKSVIQNQNIKPRVGKMA